MGTSVGTETDTIEMLQNLIQLDYAAAEAYQAAIERLDSERYKEQLSIFKGDHERHMAELKPVVMDLGGRPPVGASPKVFVTQGKVALGGLVGDQAILAAMRSNEDDTNIAYERMLEKTPNAALVIIRRGLADERRHREWINAQLDN